MPLICEPHNLAIAFLRAARGKHGRREVMAFRDNLWDNLNRMAVELANGSFRFGGYHTFKVFDPKERLICAAPFDQRVAMHAIMRVCHPVFEAYQMPHSFASRIGKGTYAAIDKAMMLCRCYDWYAKLDVRHYFDTINHDILISLLSSLFKDQVLLCIFKQLLGTYEVNIGRGLPIGNLTSQYFANHYLAVADHYAMRQLHAPAMVRYMDDVLFFGLERKSLLELIRNYVSFVNCSLRLEMHPPVFNRTSLGIPFCGYVVRARGLRLNQRSRHRYRIKMAKLRLAMDLGEISLTTYGRRVQALRAFTAKAQARAFELNESL